MAGFPSSGSKPEKSMSSRLLTMKFMQRAAASAAVNESQSPADTPSPKRHRAEQEAASPATQSDLEAISAALAEEERQRKEAVSRKAAEAGESEWVLDFDTPQYAPQPRVVTADSLDADDRNMVSGGRQKFGNFKRMKTITTADGETMTLGEDEADDVLKQEKEEAQKNRKPVRIDKITSISGAGGVVKDRSTGSPSQSKKKRKHK
ncbi:hypothetical protein P170DRAFT_472040 [Aspergillus steynii IBT 23096]|uniref:Uncharacterized protein n=1 Tax=Aspergillus steynii IBT 23096 TaxID=1392250 RepID=A0A2I2GGX2_9EURO|nr:uncharacterized protein P170DRAFT_472040 [Aspergillus steynii IBT 23096]PLB52131.1 hypothetical protein P170DRAFT_472040 [Aspergillus steynii IBT 23096]